MKEEYKIYKRMDHIEMRPYIKGENLTGISVSKEDNPETDMGMIARNPDNHQDRWYVARKYYEKKYKEKNMKKIKLFKMANGEFVISEIENTDNGSVYNLIYPAAIVPIPIEKGGGEGKLGFMKYIIFADNNEPIKLNTTNAIVATPEKKMVEAYEKWVLDSKDKESDIIIDDSLPKNMPKNKDGKVIDFSRLNIG